jgi:hypothetical protein
MKVFQWVNRLFTVLKDFAVRSGFDKWLEEHWDDILDAVIAEVISGGGLTLHQLEPRLFSIVKRITGVERDNWAKLSVGLAIEAGKAKGLIP